MGASAHDDIERYLGCRVYKIDGSCRSDASLALLWCLAHGRCLGMRFAAA